MARDNLARVEPAQDNVNASPTAATEEVLIHVRFNPSSEIISIGERPAHLSAEQWYQRLLELARPHYQTFAGNRGFFRIPRACFDGIIKEVAA